MRSPASPSFLRYFPLFALCGLLLGMVPTARATDWTTYQADNQHSGYTTANTDPTKISYQWSAPQGYGIPLLVGNSVYSMYNQQGIGSDSTKISSFNRTTGAINWTYTGNFVFPGNPTYDAGQVIFAGSPITSNSAMHVLNANTGVEQYAFSLVFSSANSPTMPTIYTNSSTGARTALFAYNGALQAVTLGTNSASTLWTSFGNGFQEGVPTIMGTSAIVVGPGHYYAFDLATGAKNQFHSGNISGGGNSTVVADAAHNRFYVQDSYSTSVSDALTAYSYTSNSTITQLWQLSGRVATGGILGNVGHPALDGNGNVYIANNTTLYELDPTTGAIVHSITGRNFPNGVAPIISNHTIWLYEKTALGSAAVSAFDLNTFNFLGQFSGGRTDSNSTFKGPGLVGDDLLIVDPGNIYGQPGFDVYFTTPVPEPSTILCFTALGLVAVMVRRRRIAS